MSRLFEGMFHYAWMNVLLTDCQGRAVELPSPRNNFYRVSMLGTRWTVRYVALYTLKSRIGLLHDQTNYVIYSMVILQNSLPVV